MKISIIFKNGNILDFDYDSYVVRSGDESIGRPRNLELSQVDEKGPFAVFNLDVIAGYYFSEATYD